MFHIAQAHDTVVAVLSSKVDLDEGMSSLIDYCAEHEPWRGWDVLRKLEFESDQLTLKRWLEELLTQEPPPDDVKAFWFGLFNPVIKGKSTCGLYATGSTTFDGNDEDFEWACNPAWLPDGRYAKSKILNDIYQRVHKAKDSVSSYQYVLCLGYAGLVLNQLATTLPLSRWLGKKSSRALAIGFDSGAGILLGSFLKQGWRPGTS